MALHLMPRTAGSRLVVPCRLPRASVFARTIVKWKSRHGSDRSPILPSSLVPLEWVRDNFQRVKLLDASWFMPNDPRNAKTEFANKHLPGAQFFDLEAVSDHSTPLPHMLPSSQQFSTEASQLGLRHDDPIVIYDSKGVFSAPRVWYTFLAFGAKDVGVMNGGLPLWESKLLPLTSETAKPHLTQFVPQNFTSDFVTDYDDVLAFAQSPSPSFQLLDARSSGRFNGSEAEPRPGLKSGHIPHSINVPYTELIKKTDDGIAMMKDEAELRAVFERAGVDLSDPNAHIVTSCGTGVTASVLALALHLLSHRNWSIYDGSWTEYAGRAGSIIAQSKQ